MKCLLLLIFIVLSLQAATLTPVAYVSPLKFSGLWYEIARTFNSFQEKCVGSSVEYVLKKSNTYDVYNRCFESQIGAKLIEYEGSAQPAKGENMSSIDMTYFWFFTKNYKVVYLEEDYTHAVIADDAFKEVWIMSRTPYISTEKLQEIQEYLKSEMNLEGLIYTQQSKEGRYK